MPPRLPRLALAAPLAGILLASMLVAAPASAHPGSTSPSPPSFDDVTVHDPSIVTSGEDIWIFGSHGASAHTTDLMSWEQHTVDLSQNADNALFDDIYTELAETFEWARTSTLWASDVIQLPDGRFAMYYNACEGSSPRSALGLATSAAVDGPYENQGILLKSGMAGESENPGETYDARVHPNAVDPDAFFDAKGNMWMVYGSYSGGIRILKMDKTTGLPLPGQGYGKHLVGGNHSRIEAPTIQYDAATGYYYLYLSFGGLDVSGGYDVRVARSKKPDGPYLDAAGNDMAAVKADASQPLFDDASIQPYGTKLMGGHLFARELGDPGSGAGVGYVSPGHTSWYKDAAGRMFLIFHARFPGTGELHQVRVHQMWMNTDGWPVVSPMRYAGETARRVSALDVIGEWDLVRPSKDITATPAVSGEVQLTLLGTVRGAASGTWRLTGANTATLKLDGEVYRGRFVPIWDPMLNAWSTGFTAVSQSGKSVWAKKDPLRLPNRIVRAVADDIDLGDTSAVTADLALPTTGTKGTKISWTSSAPSVVTATGAVTRPGIGEPDATATLTATVRLGIFTQRRTYPVTVIARTPAAEVGSWSFENDLAEREGRFPASATTGARIDLPGTDAAFVADGVAGSALHLDGTAGVRLPDGLISSRTYSVALWLRPEQLTAYTTAFFAAASPDSWVSLVPQGHAGVGGSTMLWSGANWYDAGTGVSLPVNEWSHVAFVVDNGRADVYVNGALRFTGTGFPDAVGSPSVISAIGVNWWDAPFQGDVDELTVWSSALSAQEVAALAER
ncbi:LamG-like jellyroll fold domain-containing protein [Microbacterium sp.]|uniref:LamG-like jellyroll fold domain-containing protein n=1 Tax=Microbacterium sp. TaxID=51671 RepID=UPI0039E685DF